MGAGHGHHHGHGGSGPARAGARHAPRLRLAFALIGAFFLVEAAAGLLTGSLALVADAGHMLTDVVGIGMALAAISFASRRGASGQRTFGLYRLEILAALANAALLFGVALYVLAEAVGRLSEPPEVPGGPVLAVAAAGLAVNLAAFFLLRTGAGESLNVEGAYLEVVADAVGSLGAVGAAVVLQTTGWRYVDPLVGVAVGLFILPRTWRLGGQALRILVQAAPPHVDPEAVRADLAALPGVVDVHDLHLWTLTSDMEVASAHLMVAAGTDAHGVLDQARDLLREVHRVDHATLQVEPDDHRGCEELSW